MTGCSIGALAALFLTWIASALDARAEASPAADGDQALIARQIERLTSGKAEQVQLARSSLDGLEIDDLPALLELRGHSAPQVRSWAKRGIRMLGMQDPAVAIAHADSRRVAVVIRSYANPLDFKALPVISSFLSDERMEVREAARWVFGRFGKNAIRQLRQAYMEAAGKQADSSWEADRVARELYTILDRPAVEQADALLAQGLSAFISGDLESMKQRFDRALAIHPSLGRRAEMAPGYGAYGQTLLEKGDLEAAAAAFSRALRLGPDDTNAHAWQSRLAFIRSDQQLQAGVLDLDGYREALELDPSNSQAAAALDRLGGAWLERLRARKKLARVGSVLLLGAFAFLLLLRTRSRPR